MIYRMEQVKVSIFHDNVKDHVVNKIKKRLGINLNEKDITIVKKSVDARDKSDIKFVYSLDLNMNKLNEKEMNKLKLKIAQKSNYQIDNVSGKFEYSPVVVGFGPCGMFAGLILAEAGMNPIIIERGSSIEKRVEDVRKFWEIGELNEDSNVQFGEGGAGTFSDGKLTTQIGDARISSILEKLVELGAPKEIIYKQKPHIGTDLLRKVVINLRKKIISLGGKIYFDTKLIDINQNNQDDLDITIIDKEKKSKIIKTREVILAIGHSARDTFRLLDSKKIYIDQKPLSIGVRIEHDQEFIDNSQYGKSIDILGAADYKLSYRCSNGRGVYTFCMCPGGHVISASSEKGKLVTNGMSYNKRDSGKANSALLVDVKVSDFNTDNPLGGIDFQEKYEKKAFENSNRDYKPIECTWNDFLTKTEKGMKMRNSLPAFATESILEAMPNLGKKIKDFNNDNTMMYGVETRSSSPIRIKRDESMQSNIKGVYPAGEGAGYAGGIISSAVDGIKVAEKIIVKYYNEESI